MSYINFNPTAQQGFQNALGMGMQMGAQAAEARNRREYQNALAGYDPSNPETVKPIMQVDARTGIALQRHSAQMQEAQQQRQRQQAGVMRQLLSKAKENPAQALAAANQLGIDVQALGAPDINDPNFQPWVDQQIFISDALADPDTLTSVQNDIQSLGIDPTTPEGRKAVGELVLFKYGKPTTDEYGRPALSLPTISVPQEQPAQILPQSSRPANMSDDQLFEQAQQAVEAGADVDAVFRQLKEWGVSVR